MRLQDFKKLLDRRPFAPLRVHLSNGSFYEVPHPELADLTVETLVITLPPSNAKIDNDHQAFCSWLHVTHVESIAR